MKIHGIRKIKRQTSRSLRDETGTREIRVGESLRIGMLSSPSVRERRLQTIELGIQNKNYKYNEGRTGRWQKIRLEILFSLNDAWNKG